MKKSVPLESHITANVQEKSSMSYIYGYFPNAGKFDIREIVMHNAVPMNFDGIYNANELLCGKYTLKQRIVNEYELQILAKAGKLMPVASTWRKLRRELREYMNRPGTDQFAVSFNLCLGIQDKFTVPAKYIPKMKDRWNNYKPKNSMMPSLGTVNA